MKRVVVTVVFVTAVFLFSGCNASYPCITTANVPQAVNDLGNMICQQQRSVVTPGGNQWQPGYSDNDRASFESSSKLTDIVKYVTESDTFKAGVAAIKTLTPEVQATVLKNYNHPIYPTWAMNGAINDSGTTDAGYDVETEIATALTNAVRTAIAPTK